jgi:hypothetical protein
MHFAQLTDVEPKPTAHADVSGPLVHRYAHSFALAQLNRNANLVVYISRDAAAEAAAAARAEGRGDAVGGSESDAGGVREGRKKKKKKKKKKTRGGGAGLRTALVDVGSFFGVSVSLPTPAGERGRGAARGVSVSLPTPAGERGCGAARGASRLAAELSGTSRADGVVWKVGSRVDALDFEKHWYVVRSGRCHRATSRCDGR